MLEVKLVYYTLLILIFFTTSTHVQGLFLSPSSLSSSLSSLRTSTFTTKNLERRENFHWPAAGIGTGSWWWSHLWDRYNDEDSSPPPPSPANQPHQQPQQQQTERTWWTWSSKEGYKSGHGTPPSSSNLNPTNSNLNTDVNVNTDTDTDTNSQQDDYNSYHHHHQIGSINGTQVNQWLEEHNKIRARYGAEPLTWSEELVRASKRLTDKCIWKHTSNNPFGENMSAGQMNIHQVVQGWVKGPSEKNSFSGKSNSEPSHFTQVVWLSTTELGCYQTTCQKVKASHLPQSPVMFWACNYNPPGNVIGEFKQNVKALPGGNPI